MLASSTPRVPFSLEPGTPEVFWVSCVGLASRAMPCAEPCRDVAGHRLMHCFCGHCRQQQRQDMYFTTNSPPRIRRTWSAPQSGNRKEPSHGHVGQEVHGNLRPGLRRSSGSRTAPPARIHWSFGRLMALHASSCPPPHEAARKRGRGLGRVGGPPTACAGRGSRAGRDPCGRSPSRGRGTVRSARPGNRRSPDQPRPSVWTGGPAGPQQQARTPSCDSCRQAHPARTT